MRYSIEPRDKMYVKECGFLYFAKDMGKILNNRYCQKIYSRCNKTASKRAIQKTVEATGDLIGNKITDKITNISKKSRALHSQNDEANDEIKIPRERYIFSEKRQQIIDELKLI